MKNSTDREDRMVSRMMSDFRLENPSQGFTDRVMQGIQMKSSTVDSRPLIGRAGWVGIAAGFCLLLGLIFMDSGVQSTEKAGWLSQNLPSIRIPAVDFRVLDWFAWMHPDDPTLFWIFVGIGGFILLGFLQQIFGIRHNRQINTL